MDHAIVITSNVYAVALKKAVTPNVYATLGLLLFQSLMIPHRSLLPLLMPADLTKRTILNRKPGKNENHSLFGPVTGPTGKPVRIRCGPAAVTPPFLLQQEKGPFTAMCATVANNHRNGKAVVKAGKPEDLPESV